MCERKKEMKQWNDCNLLKCRAVCECRNNFWYALIYGKSEQERERESVVCWKDFPNNKIPEILPKWNVLDM